jgi:ABC-2 type transport system permease protein
MEGAKAGMLGAHMSGFTAGFVSMWRRVFADPGALLLMVGAIALYSMFYPLPYMRQLVREIPVAVVDLDGTSLSRQLVRWTDAHENVRVVLRAPQAHMVEAALTAGDIDGYLVIPAGFRADVLRGRRAIVAYGGDAGRFLVLKQVLGAFAETTGTLSAGIEVRRLRAKGQAAEQAMAAQGPVVLRWHPLFNPREGYGTYLIPAAFVLILQQTLLLGVGLLLGTDRERCATIRSGSTGGGAPGSFARFAGECGALATLYAGHALFYFGFCFWLFDMPRWGNPVAIGVFLVPFLLAIVLFAHALGGLCRRRETSVQALLITAIPFLFLAGFAWPMELMPSGVVWLAHLVPSTAGIQGFLRLNQMGAGLPDVAHWWWTLWALCALYAWPAWWGWRRARPATAPAGEHAGS